MDKDKLAKLQAQVRIGEPVSTHTVRRVPPLTAGFVSSLLNPIHLCSTSTDDLITARTISFHSARSSCSTLTNDLATQLIAPLILLQPFLL
jgi:hypothetical protein